MKKYGCIVTEECQNSGILFTLFLCLIEEVVRWEKTTTLPQDWMVGNTRRAEVGISRLSWIIKTSSNFIIAVSSIHFCFDCWRRRLEEKRHKCSTWMDCEGGV